MSGAPRTQRLIDEGAGDDQRQAFARDRDRVLYTSALRRLANTTQVVSAEEGHVFHNRLTHTLEVAQLARRIAEHLEQSQSSLAQKLDLSPDVAETAALIHDLGHPPFGHIGEKALDKALLHLNKGLTDQEPTHRGYEGNAQSFRIVTKLARRHPDYGGLNLTRASLNACLKYPWMRSASPEESDKGWRKFSVYDQEKEEFDWVREHSTGQQRSCEAEIMDFADDVAYAVHDLYDFFKAGLIPMHRLVEKKSEFFDFIEKQRTREGKSSVLQNIDDKVIEELWSNRISLFPSSRPFAGSANERGDLRLYTSKLIGYFVRSGIKLVDPTKNGGKCVQITPEVGNEVAILQRLTVHFVIHHPTLAAIQEGQRRVIHDLVSILFEDAKERQALLPIWAKEALTKNENCLERVVADMVASLTEAQAYNLHGRLTGVRVGSIRDNIV